MKQSKSVLSCFLFFPKELTFHLQKRSNKREFRIFTSPWNFFRNSLTPHLKPKHVLRGWNQKLIPQKVNLKCDIFSLKWVCAGPQKSRTVLVEYVIWKLNALPFIFVVYLNCFGKRFICQSSSWCKFNSLDIKTIKFEVREENANLAS